VRRVKQYNNELPGCSIEDSAVQNVKKKARIKIQPRY
jgi:hypothetical protein